MMPHSQSADPPQEILAHLYDRASRHSVDNFFQAARRSVRILDRTENTTTSDCIHYIYLPFDPAMGIKLLDILRVHYNDGRTGQDGRTPAMRLGLAEAPVPEEAILAHPGLAPPMPRAKPKRTREQAEVSSDQEPLEGLRHPYDEKTRSPFKPEEIPPAGQGPIPPPLWPSAMHA